MKYSEIYRALRMPGEVGEKIIEGYSDIICALQVSGNYEPGKAIEYPLYCTTEMERSYLARMLAMPEARAFLEDNTYNKLREYYPLPESDTSDNTDNDWYRGSSVQVEVIGEGSPGRAWFDKAYIDKVRFFLDLMNAKREFVAVGEDGGICDGGIYITDVDDLEAYMDEYSDHFFYYENHTRTGDVVRGIAYPVGINVDVITHIWYMHFHMFRHGENDGVGIERVHARISRMEGLVKIGDVLYDTEVEDEVKGFIKNEWEWLRDKMAHKLKKCPKDKAGNKTNNKGELLTVDKLIEWILYESDSEKEAENDDEEAKKTKKAVPATRREAVSVTGKREYKLYIYVKNYYGAWDRAAAAFSRYKRKFSIVDIKDTKFRTRSAEKTGDKLIEGEKEPDENEKVFCFHIYYYEWERQQLLRDVLSLGKYAYVRRFTEEDKDRIDLSDAEIEECNNFISDIVEAIQRGKDVCRR